MSPRSKNWFGVGFDAWQLGLEASSVIALRTWKLAAGGSAGHAEANLMVSEKIAASLALQTKAMTGALGDTPLGITARTLAHYRSRVRANQRRLAKG